MSCSPQLFVGRKGLVSDSSSPAADQQRDRLCGSQRPVPVIGRLCSSCSSGRDKSSRRKQHRACRRRSGGGSHARWQGQVGASRRWRVAGRAFVASALHQTLPTTQMCGSRLGSSQLLACCCQLTMHTETLPLMSVLPSFGPASIAICASTSICSAVKLHHSVPADAAWRTRWWVWPALCARM